jgi:hypothetical protein
MTVHLFHLWKAVRKGLGSFGYLLGDLVAADDYHGRPERPKINKHKRRPAKGLVHSSKREVYTNAS